MVILELLAMAMAMGCDPLPCERPAITDTIENLRPCRVVRFDEWLCGGWGGVLETADGVALEFALDGGREVESVPFRSAESSSGTARLRSEKNPCADAPRVAYLYADYAGDNAARPLAVGSPAEKQLIDALQDWVDGVVPPARQRTAFAARWGPEVRPAERDRQLESLEPSTRMALDVMHMISELSNQRRQVAEGKKH